MVSPVAKLELMTAEVCPFAQRSHMALLEKELEFDCTQDMRM